MEPKFGLEEFNRPGGCLLMCAIAAKSDAALARLVSAGFGALSSGTHHGQLCHRSAVDEQVVSTSVAML